ncbi:hypothetical protein CF319_g9181 [Tilletia indica]|uniref:Hydrophobic surface binding protein A n=1 Tax=Tilletia indica TaxID=43049 RepID=A0A177TA37_9BASI|nr:hypothetical protein CF319_g9181 [Tilletia indica]KAE8219030.1 hypothetical protein CF326_g9040 [Tilletia indica]KAE8251581.1 hypothetical protein A4X13_0g3928 [Tilletia indica]
MQFSTSLFALLSLATVAMADYAALATNIKSIDTAVAALNNQLWSASVGTYSGALKVDSSARALSTKLQSAATAAGQEGVLVISDSNLMIASVKALYPKVANATSRVSALQPTFQRLGVAGIAKSDVGKLATGTSAFAQALVNVTPTQNRAAATSLAAAFNAAMAGAVAAYA